MRWRPAPSSQLPQTSARGAQERGRGSVPRNPSPWGTRRLAFVLCFYFKLLFFFNCSIIPFVSLLAQWQRSHLLMEERWVWSLGQEDLLEKEMATYSLQYSCLENSMDGGAWWATVHGVAKSRTRLSDFTSSILAWETPWPEEPGGLQSVASQKIWTPLCDKEQ